MGLGVVRGHLIGIGVAGALLIGFGVAASAAMTGLKPASPQPGAADVAPGLAVSYFAQMFQDVGEVAGRSGGEAGEPLKQINDTPA